MLVMACLHLLKILYFPANRITSLFKNVQLDSAYSIQPKNINPYLFELAPIQIELVVEVGADGGDGTNQLFKARL